jgi:methionyl-tRNA synthetase
VHRTLTFISSQFDGVIPKAEGADEDAAQILKTLEEKLDTIAREIEACRLQSAANTMISVSRIGNQYLNEKEPWNLIKEDRKAAANVFSAAAQLVKALAIASAPFVPVAAEKIWKTLNLPGSVHQQKWDEALKPLPSDHRIVKAKTLFRKIDDSPEELEEKLQKGRKKLANA